MRCPRCGNENPESNRFCGMCGATLLQAPAPATVGGKETTAAAAEPPPPAPAAPVRREVHASPEKESPGITGPSFLGLNQSSTSTRAPSPSARRNILSIDPHSSASSRDLDYLLDEDEPKGGGFWKFILIVLALGLAVGFGYLRWKDQGLAWLNSITKKPSATQTTDNPGSSEAAPAPAPSGPAAGNSNAGGGNAVPPADSGAASSPGNANAAAPTNATPPASQPAPANPGSPGANAASASPTPNPAGAAGNAAGPPPSAASPASSAGNDSGAANAGTDSAGAASANPPKDSSSTKDASDDQPAAAAAPPKASKPAPAPKHAATPKPAAGVDAVAEAQKYLYGRGAKQDCDRGLKILKPAADQSNAKAMIELGALYSAGLCTPRDLPTAYRWFAMALRKDPENQSVQTDLQKLWGEMTQPERQLAIRLTQ